MATLSKSLHVLMTAATACALTLSLSTRAGADTFVGENLVNRMDGSTLGLLDDNAPDSRVVSLRDHSKYHYLRSTVWTAELNLDPNGEWVGTLHNAANGRCLQPGTAQALKFDHVVLKPCDGSPIQQWTLRSDPGTNWWLWRPALNPSVALAAGSYGYADGYDGLYLDTAYPSADRLWQLGPAGQPT